MISQVVESDFVLGSERFFCCGFSSSSLNNAFLLHGARHSIGTGALEEAQSNNCVAVALVLLAPCRSELGRDVLADLTDVL